MRDTRLNLNNQKFEQLLTDVLNLSGFTEFNGVLRLNDGNQAVGKVMTSDITGGTSWQFPETTVVNSQNIRKDVTQTSHNFEVGTVVAYSGGTYIKAIADGTMDAETFGIVSASADTNNFTVVFVGYVSGLTELALSANTTYFVSDNIAGLLMGVNPTTDGHISKPILATTSASEGLVLHFRGSYILTGETYVTGSANVGNGIGIATGFTGNQLAFKSLSGGSGILLIDDGDTITISAGTGGGGTVTAAENGITLLGDTIVLGGTLTGDTSINTNNFGITFGSGTTAYCNSLSFGVGNIVASGKTNLSFGYAKDTSIICSNNYIDSNTNCSYGGGNIARGFAYNSSIIHSNGQGTQAMGYTYNNGKICSNGGGTQAMGRAFEYSNILTSGQGTQAMGYACSGSTIGSYGSGSMSAGFASYNSIICSTTDGSIAIGGACYSSNITSDGIGAQSIGFAKCSSSICSNGRGSIAIGSAYKFGYISSTNEGSIAGGYAGYSSNTQSNGTGSIALGYARHSSYIHSNGAGSIALGYSRYGSNIYGNGSGQAMGGAYSGSTICSNGAGTQAMGCAINFGNIRSYGCGSIAAGFASGNTIIACNTSFAMGKYGIASTGDTSFSFGSNINNGANCSIILGYNINIPDNTTYSGTTSVNKLAIHNTPDTSTCTTALVWDSVDKIVKLNSSFGLTTITGNTISGDNSTTAFTINHSCGTRDIMVQVYENQSPYGNVLVAVERPNTACITVTFDTAPTTGENYRVLMLT